MNSISGPSIVVVTTVFGNPYIEIVQQLSRNKRDKLVVHSARIIYAIIICFLVM